MCRLITHPPICREETRRIPTLAGPNRTRAQWRARTGGRCAADETCGGLGAAMEPPDGTPGSGWDVRLDTPEREALNLPPGPLDSGPGPSAGQRPTSEAHPSATRGKLEGDDRARASGEASGSGSGSPDENVNKRSNGNPPSPRELVPAGGSPEAASARAGDDSDSVSGAVFAASAFDSRRVRAEAARRARREAEAVGRHHREDIGSAADERGPRGPVRNSDAGRFYGVGG